VRYGGQVSGVAAPVESEEQADRLVVRCARPPDPDALAGLSGVASAERLPDGRFHLTLHPGADRAGLAADCVRSGWGLLELTPEQPSLERRFLELTRGGPA
jgi:hypothetical protein